MIGSKHRVRSSAASAFDQDWHTVLMVSSAFIQSTIAWFSVADLTHVSAADCPEGAASWHVDVQPG